jgi:hypothetical protein
MSTFWRIHCALKKLMMRLMDDMISSLEFWFRLQPAGKECREFSGVFTPPNSQLHLSSIFRKNSAGLLIYQPLGRGGGALALCAQVVICTQWPSFLFPSSLAFLSLVNDASIDSL